ncbi:MAG TPA: aldo/keto reductase [Candidatus Omnitrophota bacterium]|nr:aldo/keto reductase [Candidatus Omnitrophota bacterium]HPN56472.1 aldo/keto reductase [Candidatus Omnitrophota bacterium]
MKYIKEVYPGLRISALTLGTWVYGGENWGGSDDRESLNAIHAALDAGVTCIDTAPVYGQGQAETLVGQAIKGRRDKVIIATKCGLIRQGRRVMINLKAVSIRSEVEQSLRRLGTEYIDVYQCHWPDPKTPLEETMSAMCKLQGEGKIRHIGVSNFSSEQLKEAMTYTAVFSAQSQLSALTQDILRELLPFCRKEGLAVFAYGALGGGLLTGKYAVPPVLDKADARSFFYKFYTGAPFQKAQAVLDAFRKIGRPINQTAINWARQQAGVSSVVVGCRTAQQVNDNMAAADWDLSDEELEGIGRL